MKCADGGRKLSFRLEAKVKIEAGVQPSGELMSVAVALTGFQVKGQVDFPLSQLALPSVLFIPQVTLSFCAPLVPLIPRCLSLIFLLILFIRLFGHLVQLEIATT